VVIEADVLDFVGDPDDLARVLELLEPWLTPPVLPLR
jgi:hypothetical protein